MIRTVALILAILIPNMGLAQSGFPNGAKIKPKEIIKPQITEKPIISTIGKTNPKAAIYKIKSLDSGLCIGKIQKGLIDAIGGNFGYGMALTTCDDSFANYAIIPRPDSAFTIRTFSGGFVGSNFIGGLNVCANVARNVVIGPAAIDLNRCEQTINHVTAADVGLIDQRFKFDQTIDGYWQIKTFDNECLDVRNHNKSSGTEIIKWACTGAPNQKWELIFDKEINDEAILQTLRNEGIY